MAELDLLACKAGDHLYDLGRRCVRCFQTEETIQAGVVARWADGLPAIGADPAAPAIDLARAFDLLEAWISKAPSERSCWVIDRLNGKWRVGLQSGDERYTASQDAELRGAIRNALDIAKLAGCL